MGILDGFSDPYNQRVLSAGLLDMASGFSGGRGGNQAALQKQIAAESAARQKREMEMYKLQEERRRYEQSRADREAVSAAYMVPGGVESGPYGLSPDEMFYDPATEWGQGPQEEAASLLGLENEVNVPARVPSNNQEVLEGLSRVMAEGKQLTPEGVALMTQLRQGYAPQNVSAGAAMVDPVTGAQIATQDPAKVQEMGFMQENPWALQQQMQLRSAGAPRTKIDLGQNVSNQAAKAGFTRVQQGWDEHEDRQIVDNLLNVATQDMNTFQTGLGSKARLASEQAKAFVGMDPSKAAAGERLQTTMNQITLGNMAYLKGAMSEKELDFLEKASIGMENTVEGNQAIIAIYKRASDRLAQKAQAREDYFYDNEYSLRGFNQSWGQNMRAMREAENAKDQESTLGNATPAGGGWTVRRE